MHSTETRPSHSEWSSGMSRMRRLWRLQVILLLSVLTIAFHVLPLVGGRYGE